MKNNLTKRVELLESQMAALAEQIRNQNPSAPKVIPEGDFAGLSNWAVGRVLSITRTRPRYYEVGQDKKAQRRRWGNYVLQSSVDKLKADLRELAAEGHGSLMRFRNVGVTCNGLIMDWLK